MKQYQADLYRLYHQTVEWSEKFKIAKEIILSQTEDPIPHFCLIEDENDFEGELWKPLPQWEQFYLFSNFGRCRRLFRHVGYRNGTPKKWKEKVIIPSKTDKRLRLTLFVNNKRKTIFSHQGVMRTFFDNPLSYRVINHVDGDQHNNHFLNLEYCTHQYNEQHSFGALGKKIVRGKLGANPSSKGRVGQFSLSGELIRTFECIKDTGNYGFDPPHVGAVIKGDRSVHANSTWRFM